MEKPHCRPTPIIFTSVIVLGIISFSCCLAAEFKKSKAKEIKLDGSLCHMPRSPAFGLGVAALVCLSIAQIAGTSVAATHMCSKDRKNSPRTKCLSIILLILSWISFGIAVIILGAGSSMSNKQGYGNGWMNGECYVVKDGMFIVGAVLVGTTVVFICGFMFATTSLKGRMHRRRTGPDEERNVQANEEK